MKSILVWWSGHSPSMGKIKASLPCLKMSLPPSKKSLQNTPTCKLCMMQAILKLPIEAMSLIKNKLP